MFKLRLPSLDRFELAVLAAFALLSMWVVGLDLFQVAFHGREWTGTDGVYLSDQLQYLAWIRDASRHFLVSNLFVLRPTPASYFQPAIAFSGGLTALGVPPWLSLLVWKPVAVGGSFYAVRQYLARTLSGALARRVALVLALFFGSVTVVYGSPDAIGDLILGFLSWGYVFALLAVALTVAALLSYARHRDTGRTGWLPGALGALVGLLHPWHGAVLIAIVIGGEVMIRASRRSWRDGLRLPLLTVLIVAVPLLYYVLLARIDLSWHLARLASKHAFSLGSILLAVAPLIVPALLVYARKPETFLGAATRCWPLAAIAVYALSSTGLAATPLHAFEGITIPLSVLAVQGLGRAGWERLPHHRLLAGLAVAAFTLPATAYELAYARRLVSPQPGRASFVNRYERRALDYLAHVHGPGGVITRSYLGVLVPEATGRRTLVGHCLWSQPRCDQRLVAVRTLFTGSPSPRQAREFVRRSGARFVLADCRPTTDLVRLLGPLVRSRQQFGCARVYELQDTDAGHEDGEDESLSALGQ